MPGLAADFSGFAGEGFAEAAALSRFLSLGQRRDFSPTGQEEAALTLFEVPFDTPGPPVAPFSYLGDSGRPPQRYVLRADPVHLRADTQGLILFDAATFPFSDEESQALADTLAGFLAGDGWQLEKYQAQRWYLTGLHSQAFSAAPLGTVRGKPLGDFLPTGRDAPAWLARCNEIQMLMYSHPVNRERAARGLPLVNGLWVWGGGELPDCPDSSYARVFADDGTIRGLASHLGASCGPVPADAATLLQQTGSDDRLLVLLDDCSAAAAYRDFRHWNEAVERLERDWFKPLLAALAGARIRSVELLPLNGYRYRMSPVRRWQFWRRTRTYREVLASLCH